MIDCDGLHYFLICFFFYRRGRITASNFRSSCITNLQNPSISTIKNICYGQKFSSAATRYGCQHENVAINDFIALMIENGHHIRKEASGLILNPSFAEFGATPDALVIFYILFVNSRFIQIRKWSYLSFLISD
jgi:hypothetical protein